MLHVDQDVLDVLAALFKSGWTIFTSFVLPGTNINVAEFSFSCILVWFIIRNGTSVIGVFNKLKGYSDNSDDN